MSSDEFIEVKITLPRHLATWLQDFSKAIAMTPSQLMANILTYYYEAWRIGYEQSIALKEEKYCSDTLYNVAQAFFNSIPKARYKHVKAIINNFIKWICENKLEVSSDHVKKFLEEYAKSRTLKKSTISAYSYALRKFIEFYEKWGQKQ